MPSLLSFSDVRLVGRVASVSSDGSLAMVSVSARSGNAVEVAVAVPGGVVCGSGDVVSVLGEIAANGSVRVPQGFGEFVVLSHDGAAEAVAPAVPAAASAVSVRPIPPRPAARPPVVAAPVRPGGLGGFGRPAARPAAPQVAAAPAAAAAGPVPARPAAPAAATVPAAAPRPGFARPGGFGGVRAAPAPNPAPVAAPAAAAPARTVAPARRSGMMGPASSASDEVPPDHDGDAEESRPAARTTSAPSPGTAAKPATPPGGAPKDKPDETDMDIPW